MKLSKARAEFPKNAGIKKGIAIRKKYCIFLNDFSETMVYSKDIDFASLGMLRGSKPPADTELSVEIDRQKAHFFCMKYLITTILLVFASLSFAFAANDSSKLPVSVFTSDTLIRDARISPNGAYLAIVSRIDGDEKLIILDMKTRRPISSFYVQGKNRSFGDVDWVTENRFVYGTLESYPWDNTPRNTGELIGANVDGSKHKHLLGWKAGISGIGSNIRKPDNDYGFHEIVDLLPEDKKNIIVAFYPWRASGNLWTINEKALPILYRLNVLSGKKKKLGKLPAPLAKALADSNGDVRFSVSLNNQLKTEVHYRQTVSADWERFSIAGTDGLPITPISFSADNQSIFFSAHVNNGTLGVYRLNLSDKTTKLVFHDESVDPSRYIFDLTARNLVGLATEIGQPKYHYIEPSDHKIVLHRTLQKMFPDHDAVITSSTRDGRKSLALITSDTNPGDFYVFHRDEKRLEYLFSYMKPIDPTEMRESKPVTFRARDGLQLHGFLTLPELQTNKLPLVLYVHGGPHFVRDRWAFDPIVQLFAHYDYAVLRVNFRGSAGFGQAFEEAGHGQWGGTMQNDLTDAVLALVNEGVVDPNRICIFGASYGGYAALMGAAGEPDLFRCAIGSSGVYDLPMMFEKGDIRRTSAGIEYLKQTLGTEEESQRVRSPTYNAHKMTGNVLLLHGSADQRAPIEQANAMKAALNRSGKAYEWLEIKGEGHGFFDEKNRELAYRRILTFIDANIGSVGELGPVKAID